MTRGEIIQLAQEVYGKHTTWHGVTLERLLMLAERIAAAEREAVLDLVDAFAKNNLDLAAAIRARGTDA